MKEHHQNILPKELQPFQKPQASVSSNPEIKFLTPQQVAELTGIAAQTLANSRHRRKGIPYSKVGASIRYSLADVIRYMNSRRIDPEAV